MKYLIFYQISLITKLISILLSVLIFNLNAQDSTWSKTPTINFTGFLDVFYVYDFNKPSEKYRQTFLYNHNRHNEFNLNLGIIKLALNHKKYRSNLAFHTGTYVNDNYAKEPLLLKFIAEAAIGLSINKKNNWWIDVGIFPSHIGFESAISTDNLTMTRSILAENSPYFFAGVKSTYNSKNKKIEVNASILNGWQRIERVAGSSIPAFGTQLKWTPFEKILVNWSTFVGSDDVDSIRRMRYFNNVYAQIQASKKWKVITGFDYGIQQDSKGSTKYNQWWSPVLIGQYCMNESWKLALRVEKYCDKDGIMIESITNNGFDVNSFSLNTDFTPNPAIMWRIETRLFQSENKEFKTTNGLSNYNFIIGTSIALKI